jgi:hypothetical protein
MQNLGMPPGIDGAMAWLEELDGTLVCGLSNARADVVVSELPHVFGGTPLAPLAGAVADALSRSSVREEDILSLAAARVALTGALYDMIRGHLRAALGRPTIGATTAILAQPAVTPALLATRSWLIELAIRGFVRVDGELLQQGAAALTHLRQDPRFAPAATIVGGLIAEIGAALPLGGPDAVPLLRWSDLWSHAMIACSTEGAASEGAVVQGDFLPLGIELQRSGDAAGIGVYGIFDDGTASTWTCLRQTRYAPSVVEGSEVWPLFAALAPALSAVADRAYLRVRNVTRFPDGTLGWGNATAQAASGSIDNVIMALRPRNAAVQTAAANPLQRHPLRIAEPVALGASIRGDVITTSDGLTLPLDARGLGATALSARAVRGADTLIGLIRFDAGRFTFQPLTACAGTTVLGMAGEEGASLVQSGRAVATLEERAKYLLRSN